MQKKNKSLLNKRPPLLLFRVLLYAIMKKKIALCLSILLLPVLIVAQNNGIIRGRVVEAETNMPLPFATVLIQGTGKAAATDTAGRYELKNLEAGLYNIDVRMIGYKPKTVFEIQVTNTRPAQIDVVLQPEGVAIDSVVITASPFNKTAESPVSLRTIGVAEIERAPGGNRDISKVIQSLPGVASSVSFRNDIIIRGGAPNENRFYLDGIEVPNINHFATQGSSGGPVGMINVNFLREVDVITSAFPANRGNAMSSVFDFKMKEGNADKLLTTATVGASDLGLTFDGPLGKNSNFIFSARRSYLQFLFAAIGLPFLPTYNDAQFKYTYRFKNNDELKVIGLGAIDDFSLNLDANETEYQKYLLDNLPVNTQWNYTVGSSYKHLMKNGNIQFFLSRNHLKNNAIKYYKNDDSDPANLIQDYSSQEIENKFRYEQVYRNNFFKIVFGAGVEDVTYTNATYNKIVTSYGPLVVDFDSELRFLKMGAFVQASKTVASDRLTLALGLRTDWNTYSTVMMRAQDQLSPRFSLAYDITEHLSFNMSTGRYYQLPAYTVMGFRNTAGTLVNKANRVRYVQCDHITGGFEYNSTKNSKFTVEGFYKWYDYYPFQLNDSISLANLGADFGIIGNEAVTSTSKGRAYGIEFLAQQKLMKGFYGILSLTLVRSEFKTKADVYAPSAWDNGYIVSMTGGKKFKKNWEFGMRWRLQGGSPYTPDDIATSSLQNVWNITGRGIPNYDLLNSERTSLFHQLDARVDKKWFLKKVSLNLYLDIQNVYNYQPTLNPILLAERDANGNLVTDPNNPAAYKTYQIENKSGNVLPTVGLILEF